jgi:hypothetical protein
VALPEPAGLDVSAAVLLGAVVRALVVFAHVVFALVVFGAFDVVVFGVVVFGVAVVVAFGVGVGVGVGFAVVGTTVVGAGVRDGLGGTTAARRVVVGTSVTKTPGSLTAGKPGSGVFWVVGMLGNASIGSVRVALTSTTAT